MGFLIGTDGWGVYTPSVDSRVVYVDPSKTDNSGDGLSPATAKKTIAGAGGGVSLMRDGYPDWLLLLKGATCTDDLPGALALSGRSATEPMLFGSYSATGVTTDTPRGTATGARPIIEMTGVGGSSVFNFGADSSKGDNIVIVGIEGYCYDRNPADGRFSATARDATPGFIQLVNNPQSLFLVEDCKASYFNGGFGFTRWPNSNGGTLASGIRLRRNIICKGYGTNGLGVFADGFEDIELFENVIDSNDWNNDVGDWHYQRGVDTLFNHGLYLNDRTSTSDLMNGPATLTGNIMSRGSVGGHARCGGFLNNNLYAMQGTALDIGRPRTGIDYYAINEVVTELRTIDLDATNNPGYTVSTTPEGQATYFDITDPEGSNIDAGTFRFRNGLFKHFTGTLYNGFATCADGAGALTIADCVAYKHAWGPPSGGDHGSFKANAGATSYTPLRNREYNLDASSNPSPHNNVDPSVFPDPERTLSTYATTLGLGLTTADGLLDYITANQSKDTWDDRLTAAAINDYLRAGFGMVTLTGTGLSHRVTLQVSAA